MNFLGLFHGKPEKPLRHASKGVGIAKVLTLPEELRLAPVAGRPMLDFAQVYNG